MACMTVQAFIATRGGWQWQGARLDEETLESAPDSATVRLRTQEAWLLDLPLLS